MLDTLISSKTRIKLLLKFFLNSNTKAYLRSLEGEFGESSNAIRIELNRMEEAGMLRSFLEGNRKMFQANTSHPLFREIHNILIKNYGLDQIISTVIDRLGDMEKVFLIGDFSRGVDSHIIDLLFIGNIDKAYLLNLVERAEKLVARKIRYVIYHPSEATPELLNQFEPAPLLLWAKEQ